MPLDEGDRAIIKDITARFVNDKDFTQETACAERRGNVKEQVSSLNKKFWAVILLLLANLAAIALQGVG